MRMHRIGYNSYGMQQIAYQTMKQIKRLTVSKDEIPSEIAKLIQAVGNYFEINESHQKAA